MITFIVWFAVLVGVVKITKGWTRGLLLAVFIIGSVTVALNTNL